MLDLRHPAARRPTPLAPAFACALALPLALALAFTACEAPDADEAPAADTAAPPDTAAPADVMAAQADTASVMDQVTRMRQSWVRAAEANDPDAIARMYAEDALVVASTGQRLEGRQAIRDGFAGSLAGLSNMHVTSVHTEVASEMVSDLGTFTQIFQGPDGQQTLHGNYLVVARRRPDGSYEIVMHLGGPFPGASGTEPGEAADTTG